MKTPPPAAAAGALIPHPVELCARQVNVRDRVGPAGDGAQVPIAEEVADGAGRFAEAQQAAQKNRFDISLRDAGSLAAA